VYAGLADKHQQVLADKYQQVFADKSTLGLPLVDSIERLGENVRA
jgi:hypothetical protein